MEIILAQGNINRDDILAAGLIHHISFDGSMETISISRRTPNKKAFDDSNIFLVNTGKILDPELGNFDARHAGIHNKSAFIEVVQHLGLEERLSIFPWYKATQMFAENPRKLAEYLGISKLHRELDSPFEQALALLPPEEAVPTASRLVGQLLAHANKILKSQECITTINLLGHLILVNPGTCDEASRSFRIQSAPEAVAVVSKDRTGPGWTLHKFNSKAPIDLSRIDKRKILHHQTDWFFVKTRSMELQQAIDLLKLCITCESAAKVEDVQP